MSNIREVKFERTDPEPDPDLIAMLEQWTAMARSGELGGAAIAGVKNDGTVSTEWFGATRGWKHQLISGITIMLHRMVNTNADLSL